ncbi:FAD-dependent oxidoreductase, partial [Saccharothrix sp. MB29]|nr:FAD-dependent oxidoreductase [Saccharothrix sp. MB29]
LLVTSAGVEVTVDHAVLCFGAGKPVDVFGLTGTEGFVAEPYPTSSALANLDEDADVVVIGTGLTGVDVALALDRLGHRGRVRLLSRRGVLPGVRQRPIHHKLRHFTPQHFRRVAAAGGSLTLPQVVALMETELRSVGETCRPSGPSWPPSPGRTRWRGCVADWAGGLAQHRDPRVAAGSARRRTGRVAAARRGRADVADGRARPDADEPVLSDATGQRSPAARPGRGGPPGVRARCHRRARASWRRVRHDCGRRRVLHPGGGQRGERAAAPAFGRGGSAGRVAGRRRARRATPARRRARAARHQRTGHRRRSRSAPVRPGRPGPRQPVLHLRRPVAGRPGRRHRRVGARPLGDTGPRPPRSFR